MKEKNPPFDSARNGKRLREIRSKHGITAKQLAEEIGSTEASICAYERGIRDPYDEIKVRIANYFDMTVQELFFNK